MQAPLKTEGKCPYEELALVSQDQSQEKSHTETQVCTDRWQFPCSVKTEKANQPGTRNIIWLPAMAQTLGSV